MNIEVVRYGFGIDSTGGLLSVDGVHLGYTCEDQKQPKEKISGETCIPAGKYQVKLRDIGSMTQRYYAKFPGFHRGMLHLQDVPGFEFIYIHIGNTDDHTEGCILVGRSSTRMSNGEYIVGDSTQMYVELYQMCIAAIERGEDIHVEVI